MKIKSCYCTECKGYTIHTIKKFLNRQSAHFEAKRCEICGIKTISIVKDE